MTKANIKQAKELARLSSDCSFLLTHLIRKPNTEAFRILQLILDLNNINNKQYNPTLKGSLVGWFSAGDAKIYNPETNDQFISPSQKKGICFTDSTLAGLKAHQEVFKVEYGLAFDRDFLFKNGANPCLNIRQSILKEKIGNSSRYNHVYNYIPDLLAGFVNIIHDSFDATHEREWRIMGDLNFKLSDVKFVFCPEKDFDKISGIQINGVPTLFDLKWLYRI